MATEDKISLNIDTNIDKIVKQVVEMSKKLLSTQQSILKANKNIMGSKEYQKFKKELEDAADALDELTKKQKENTKETKSQTDATDKASKATEKANKEWDNTKDKLKSVGKGISSLIPLQLGLGFSIGAAMTSAFNFSKTLNDMRVDMGYLSDASGNASAAIGTMYNIAAGSGVSRATAKSVMVALNSQGVELGKTFTNLGKISGDLSMMTGVAASEWGNLTGEMSYTYGVPEKGIKNISSAIVGTGLKGTRLQAVMKTVNKVFADTAFITGKVNPQAMEATTKAIGAASVAFNKLGIKAETASAFIEGIMNPENYEKNSYLFAKLGIGAAEYADMLNDANGQQKLLEKTMKNLPALATEISNIKNPYARMDFAKQLGLSQELVAKMQGKTAGEIETLMKEYQNANQKDEAIKKKREAMAAETAKIDDALQDLKIKALTPFIKVVNKGMPVFLKIMESLAGIMEAFFSAVEPYMADITNFIKVGAEFAKDFVKGFVTYMKPILSTLKTMFEGVLGIFTTTSVDAKGNKKTEMSGIAKTLSLLATGYVAFKGFQKVMSFFRPGQKRIIDGTFDDLTAAIVEAENRGKGGMLTGRLFSVFRNFGMTGVMRYLKVIANSSLKTVGLSTSKISSGARFVFDPITKMFGSVSRIFSLLGDKIKYVIEIFSKFGSKFSWLSNFFGKFFQGGGGISKLFGNITKIFPAIFKGITMVGAKILSFANVIGWVITALQALKWTLEKWLTGGLWGGDEKSKESKATKKSLESTRAAAADAENKRTLMSSSNLSDAWNLDGEWGLYFKALWMRFKTFAFKWVVNPIIGFFDEFWYLILKGMEKIPFLSDKLGIKDGVKKWEDSAAADQRLKNKFNGFDPKKLYSDIQIKNFREEIKKSNASFRVKNDYLAMLDEIDLAKELEKALGSKKSVRLMEEQKEIQKGILDETKKANEPKETQAPPVVPDFYDLIAKQGFVLGV